MLKESELSRRVLPLDRELVSRLRRTAAESAQWAEKLCDLLNDALETHCKTLEGVEQYMASIACRDVDGGLRAYLTLRQEMFSDFMHDSFLALQIQDVTMQAIERACDAMEKRLAVLDSSGAAHGVDQEEALDRVLAQYVESDDLHRGSHAAAA